MKKKTKMHRIQKQKWSYNYVKEQLQKPKVNSSKHDGKINVPSHQIFPTEHRCHRVVAGLRLDRLWVALVSTLRRLVTVCRTRSQSWDTPSTRSCIPAPHYNVQTRLVYQRQNSTGMLIAPCGLFVYGKAFVSVTKASVNQSIKNI